eukprot:g2972.t1
MMFNFRYSGGLSQYWVIVVSYVVFKWLSALDASKFPHGTRWLCRSKFTPQEHAIVTLCGTAAAFCQSLGLSGGLATLSLFYKHDFSLREIFIWTFTAGFFGIFVGLTFGQKLVIGSRYPWPVAQMNAETIASFHGRLAPKKPETPDGAEEFEENQMQAHNIENPQDSQSQYKAMKIFAICFAVVLPWYLIANIWLKFLVTFPVLCWVSESRIGQVLGEGYTGVGMPGLSLGPSIILGWNGSIIALETTIWLVVGSVLNFWILSPALYYSGDIANTGESNGLAVWPGGLNIYTETGAPYSDINLECRQFQNHTQCSNATFARQRCVWEAVPGVTGGDSCSAGRIMLSSTMWLTMVGISWTLIGSIVDAGIDVYCPSMCCDYPIDEDDEDNADFDDPVYGHMRRNRSPSEVLTSTRRPSKHGRSSSYNEIDAESTKQPQIFAESQCPYGVWQVPKTP